VIAAIFQRVDAGAMAAFDQHFDGAVRQFQQLQNGGGCSNRVQVIAARIVRRGILLGDQHNFIVALIYHFERAYRLVSAHKERRHHVWKNHNVSQRENWEGFRRHIRLLCIWPRSAATITFTLLSDDSGVCFI